MQLDLWAVLNSPVQAVVSGAASAGPAQAVRCLSRSAVADSSIASSGPEQALRPSTTAAAASSCSAGSGPVQANQSFAAAADDDGLEQAMRTVAAISERAAADGASLEQAMQQHAARVSGALRVGEQSSKDLHNPWNLFQHEPRGKGWSPAKMPAMHKKWRQHPKDKMP